MGSKVSSTGLEALVVSEAKRSPLFGMASRGHACHTTASDACGKRSSDFEPFRMPSRVVTATP